MRCAVIGYGSIGSRHTRILNELGHTVSVVSRRRIEYPHVYNNVIELLQEQNPEYIVIANATHEHKDTINQLQEVQYEGILLVEKPLISTYDMFKINMEDRLFVGYNLRFHPLLRKLNDLLNSNNEKIISMQVYTGQYLPNWRPNVDYTNSYSSKKQEGGGVLLDLSHELDYINWICGGWEEVTAIGGKYSRLKIDSDDVYGILLKTKICPIVSVQLNYLDRVSRREILINTSNTTIKIDFINCTLQINDQIEQLIVGKDFTYKEMHSQLLTGCYDNACSYFEGIEVVKMIESIEAAEKQRKWITRC